MRRKPEKRSKMGLVRLGCGRRRSADYVREGKTAILRTLYLVVEEEEAEEALVCLLAADVQLLGSSLHTGARERGRG
jgi:hypothetical protein